MLSYSNSLKLASVLFLVLVFWRSSESLKGQNEKNPQNPNIIIIYADDVGYGDISAYNSDKISTPEIDKLADNGLLFTSAYSTAATCTPSRYSLLTGEYAFRNDRAQILSGDAPILIAPNQTTLPSILNKAGYHTSIVGKWHLGLGEGKVNWNKDIKPGPLEIGFDESFIIPATNDRVPTVYVKGHRVYNLSEDDKPLRVNYQEKIGNLPTGKSQPEQLRYPADPQHSGTIVNNISRIGWMEGGQSAWWKDEEMPLIFSSRSKDFIERNQNSPFFLFLSLHEAHVPRAPNDKFLGQSESGIRGDAVKELDWIVGEVVDKLDEMDIRDQTMVIFTSDNGPIFDDGYSDGSIKNANGHNASGPFRGGKYLAYEGGTRVPFIISWPERIEKGETSAIVSQVDLLASIANIINEKPPGESAGDSHNLISTFMGNDSVGREYVVQQSPGGLAIRKGKWKLIPESNNAPQWVDTKHNEHDNPLSTPVWGPENHLYNLEIDPGENNNIAEKHPEIVRELLNLLSKIRENPEVLPRNSQRTN